MYCVIYGILYIPDDPLNDLGRILLKIWKNTHFNVKYFSLIRLKMIIEISSIKTVYVYQNLSNWWINDPQRPWKKVKKKAGGENSFVEKTIASCIIRASTAIDDNWTWPLFAADTHRSVFDGGPNPFL